MRELATLFRHPIQIRSAMKFPTKWLDVAVAKVVAKHKYQIGWRFFLRHRCSGGRGEKCQRNGKQTT
jgi:hypothetical protein